MRSTLRRLVSLSSSYFTFEPLGISMNAKNPSSIGSSQGMSCHGWVISSASSESSVSVLGVSGVGRVGGCVVDGSAGIGATVRQRLSAGRERSDLDEESKVVVRARVVLHVDAVR